MSQRVVIELIGVALVATCVSLMLNRLMVTLAPRLGLMDQPGDRRIHTAPIPRAGGLAVWVTFLLVMAVGLSSGLVKPGGLVSWEWLTAFTLGSAVLIAAGIVDDRNGLRPWVKLGAHTLAPTVFFLLNPITIGIFPEGCPIICDFLVFVFWAVILINAFNLIDGLDGLCGGLAMVAVVALAGLGLVNQQYDSSLVLLVMAGALAGFLRYNLNPARIFLGDAGSMLIGFFLATAATEAVGRKALIGVLLLPIAVAGVPLLDVLLAIWRRGMRKVLAHLKVGTRKGGLFDADSDHLHHRLLSSGLSQRRVAMILQGLAIVLALLAFMPMFVGAQIFGLSIVGLLIVGLMGLRYVARVEIEHTGSVVHMAIKLPRRRRWLAVTMFFYDLMALALAAVGAVWIETNFLTRGPAWNDVLRFVIVFMIFGFVALFAAKVHQRLWVRATMRDVLSLQCWLMAAAGAAFVISSLANKDMEWSAIRMSLLALLFSGIAITVPRVLLDLMREAGMDARHAMRTKDHSGFGPVVVLGAGDLGTLFLEHLKSSSHGDYFGMHVVGFLDEQPSLHGRRLRPFRVIGGLNMVPGLVERENLQGIVLAINKPQPALVAELTRLAGEHNLRIYRFHVGLREDESFHVPCVERSEAENPKSVEQVVDLPALVAQNASR